MHVVLGTGERETLPAGRLRRLLPARPRSASSSAIAAAPRRPTRPRSTTARSATSGSAATARWARRRPPRRSSPTCAATRSRGSSDGRHHDARELAADAARTAPAVQRSRRATLRARSATRPRSSSRSARPASTDYELLEPEERRGFALLPAPSPGDLFFDIEGDPFWRAGRGLEYLFGVLGATDGERASRPFWAHDRAAGAARVRGRSIDFVHERLAARPRHARLPLRALRADRAQAADGPARHARGRGRRPAPPRGLRRPLHGRRARRCASRSRATRSRRSRAFYMRRATPRSRAATTRSSRYEQWLETGDDAAPRRDRGATTRRTASRRSQLRDWLLERRGEAEAQFGVAIPWREPPEPREPEPEEAARPAQLRERAARVGCATSDGARARWRTCSTTTAARRSPVWWAFFARLDDDGRGARRATREAIGGLEPDGAEPETASRESLVYGVRFPRAAAQARRRRRRLRPGDRRGRRADRASSTTRAGTLRLRRGPSARGRAAAARADPRRRRSTRRRSRRRCGGSAARCSRATAATRTSSGSCAREPPLGGAPRPAREPRREQRELVARARGLVPLRPGPARLGQDVDAARA